jgi:hypothetical protein
MQHALAHQFHLTDASLWRITICAEVVDREELEVMNPHFLDNHSP